MSTSKLVKTDFNTALRSSALTQIIGNDDTVWQQAAIQAEGTLRDCLHVRYDVDTIFASLADYQHVKRWLIVIALYYMWERVPDAKVPPRVVKNYDDVMAMCLRFQNGKATPDLPPVTDDDGNLISTLRMGSETKRSH
jgi:hypothetical protein